MSCSCALDLRFHPRQDEDATRVRYGGQDRDAEVVLDVGHRSHGVVEEFDAEGNRDAESETYQRGGGSFIAVGSIGGAIAGDAGISSIPFSRFLSMPSWVREMA